MVGDFAANRIGVQVQGSRDALNFEDYIFRICPMFNYRYRNEFEVRTPVAGRYDEFRGGRSETTNRWC